jgi:4-hydroxybenzoate polyprenyltransferase/phosphoserine phosphatase
MFVPPPPLRSDAAADLPGMTPKSSLPLCVDCDGTLIATDLLHESTLRLIRTKWWALAAIPFWLLRGRAYLKTRIAELVSLDAAQLPYNAAVVELVTRARNDGRKTVLATGSALKLAQQVASHTGIFDEIIATETVNLSGSTKAAELERRFGRGGFEYAGNGRADIPVWAVSGGGVVVSGSESLQRAAKRVSPVVEVLVPRNTLRQYLSAIRLHQWIKNLLVFIPLLASHRAGRMPETLSAVLAFIAFGLCASAVYVVNDLLDLESDRAHPRKRERPFASGVIPVSHGLVLAPLLLVGSALTAARLPTDFQFALAGYFALTCVYSAWLKAKVIVDVLILTSLYTLRIIAGGAATDIVPSFWLLAFSMSIFLSLALCKRYAEVLVMANRNESRAAGRGYLADDLPLLMSLGTSAGIAAVLVLALYVNSPDVGSLYPRQWGLWMVLPAILYWISRTWMKTRRGEMHDDPLVFAITDRVSWTLALVVAAALWIAARA